MPRSRVSGAADARGPRGAGRGWGGRAGRDVVSARPCRPDRLTNADSPAGPQGAGRGCRSRRGRPQRPGLAGSSAALSAAGCGPVRLRPTRLPRRCPVPAMLAELWPCVRTAVSAVDTAAACGCPRLTWAWTAGVRRSRKRSPGDGRWLGAASAARPATPAGRAAHRAGRARSALIWSPTWTACRSTSWELLGELPSTRHEPLQLGVVHYRSLFEELLEVGPADPGRQPYDGRRADQPTEEAR